MFYRAFLLTGVRVYIRLKIQMMVLYKETVTNGVYFITIQIKILSGYSPEIPKIKLVEDIKDI